MRRGERHVGRRELVVGVAEDIDIGVPADGIEQGQVLRGDDAFPQVGGEGLTVASDLLLFHGGDYYFVKPLVRRLWLATAAAQDAWRIVQTVRQGAPIQ